MAERVVITETCEMCGDEYPIAGNDTDATEECVYFRWDKTEKRYHVECHSCRTKHMFGDA